jgi:hypothetical protein
VSSSTPVGRVQGGTADLHAAGRDITSSSLASAEGPDHLLEGGPPQRHSS